ncbi:MAG: aminotransferase class V-fold PLP-dependent enzyme, partial [Candidatus Latescibacteria bacterium]|nr:aminotransferase class V-fold PLP-dependent enzyme [Candidatus Latescibacterota bacterium]
MPRKQKPEMSVDDPVRRSFLKQSLVGIGGAALLSGHFDIATAQTQMPPIGRPNSADDEGYWANVREYFHESGDVVYMNNASLGRCPRPVTQAIYDGYVALGESGAEANSRMWNKVDASRRAVARFLGADQDEVILTRNATEGLAYIARGLQMESGEAVLMTTDEHGAGRGPWIKRADRYGLQIDRVKIPAPPASVDEVVGLFRRAITPKTRVVFFSHITRGPGLLLPAKELCRMAREQGLVSAVDGAQSPGMTPVDLHDMGCDLFATSLHKWALTPPGTGALYVKKEFNDRFWPRSNGGGPWDGLSGIRNARTEGTLERPVRVAIKTALDFINSIGLDTIIARNRMLSDQLKDGLGKLSGVHLATSRDPALSSSGITSFSIEGWSADLIGGILQGNFNIVTSEDVSRYNNMVRISTHF